MTQLLLFTATIIIICIFTTKLSTHLKIPTLIIFIMIGILFGTDGLFKVHFEDFIISEQICSFALIFIMFYGGFCLNFKSAKPIIFKATLLSTWGVILTCLFIGLFCFYILKTSFWKGILIGAVLTSTDAASVFSILRMKKINLKEGLHLY